MFNTLINIEDGIEAFANELQELISKRANNHRRPRSQAIDLSDPLDFASRIDENTENPKAIIKEKLVILSTRYRDFRVPMGTSASDKFVEDFGLRIGAFFVESMKRLSQGLNSPKPNSFFQSTSNDSQPKQYFDVEYDKKASGSTVSKP